MRKVILKHSQSMSPFNEPARDLQILNKPLHTLQNDLLARYTNEAREVETLETGSDSLAEVPQERLEQIVYRDNLFFDQDRKSVV